jgi:hypothetical protein
MTTLEGWAYVIMQAEVQWLINFSGATWTRKNSIVNKKEATYEIQQLNKLWIYVYSSSTPKG